MDGKLHNKIDRFLLALLLVAGVCVTPASANLKRGAWQELSTSTDAINGTVPQADGATTPVYQGSVLLTPDTTHSVAFTAMPRDFSVTADSNKMQAVNPRDTEGDIFSTPPLRWENQQSPTVGLVWADAATPDEPLNPQPVQNQTFCAQNLAGRHLVVWPEIESDDTSPIPTLYLWTTTGIPNSNTVSLLQQKIAIDIAAATGEPVTVSANHYNESLAASKVKAGESITLTITTKDCAGNPVGNAPFVIRRDDALNRKGVVNNDKPVHVGDTELTTTTTFYRGTTSADGTASVVVTQPDGPGVKTPLIISSESFPELKTQTDVIFTTLTSPDSELAAMYGHMQESATAELNGVTYTFTRPKLAAETSNTSGTVVDKNETWAQFNWAGADNHCDILPDAEQIVAMRNAHDTEATYTGWPVTNDAEYWSSTKDQLEEYHYAVHINSGRVIRESNRSAFLVSCVDKALPAAHPQITLSPSAPYKAEVGDSIELTATVVDRDTQQPLPYRYMELFIDSASNRQGVHKAEWDNLPVTINSDDMRASSPEHYTGVTDANGQIHLDLKHDNGVGVETPIRIVMEDDDGNDVELPFSVIFTVVTSPDVEGANMYGHMRGVVDAGNLYKRPLLAVEASHKTGQQSENNEDWATFSSVEAATAQCGTGQVPNSGSLEHLYSEHPDNQMLTEHGWPTNSHPYIAAETSDSQTAYVNLANGGQGYGSQPNYLTCSANEMVATLDVYFNDDVAVRNAEAKVGEQIKMNVHSTNALNGEVIPYTNFTVTLSPGKQRDGLTTGFTDPSNGELIIDGAAYSAAQAAVYHGITDAQGNAEVLIEQPRGVGLLTQLSIAPEESLLNISATRSVKFTVATSPNTPDANMWGHMPDTITVGDMTFERPKLAHEVSATRVQNEANESWARVTHADAEGNLDAGGCPANRLPRIDQLEALYNANSGGAMHSVQGWPVAMQYWSSSPTSPTTWKMMALDTGAESPGGNVTLFTSCLTHDNPVAASITIEPVDASLWYDATNVHAVKVKKGDTLQLKVTVKDASGMPLPNAPFVLSRGDGYNRQGNKYIAAKGNSDAIVTPVVIDGEALNDTATKKGAVTGSDGSKIINVTRPDTHGTRTAITAALYDNAGVNASIDTIFTVITSPDSKKAEMWGHMAESLTAEDGTVYQRPLLYSELSSTSNTAQYTEDNEYWAGFYGPGSSKNNAANCPAGYYPSVTALDSLYKAYPGRTIKTAQGWPIDHSYWSGTPSQPLSLTTPNTYYIVDLDDGSRRAIVNSSINNMQYQICASKRVAKAAQIVLSSSLALDGASQSVKVKNSDPIPVTVTTTDAAGNPVGNTPFAIKHDAGTARNTSYSGWEPFQLTIDGTSQVWSKDDTYYGTTGDDGTLTFEVYGERAPGVKNILTASLYETPTVTSTMPVIFTVVTSPDSDQANMWGHMAETFSASNGVEFMRPRLRYEEGSSSNTSYIAANNEAWLSLKASLIASKGIGACGLNQMPLLADLTSLYNDHPNGKLETDLGMPLTTTSSTRWWSGDPILINQSVNYQYYNMKSGGGGYNAGNENYLQICLTQPRQAHVALSLTSWDEAKAAAVVKKGESINATVAVTDGSGQPMSHALVKLTRSDALTRAGSVYTTNNADDITLSNVQPSGTSSFVMDTSSRYLYVETDAQGRATFTVSQNASAGLKTTLSAAMMTDSATVDSKDAIFTVITSPDSDSAAMWGHMPETVTNSAGVTFRRPLLSAEMPTSVPSTHKLNNETWPLVNKANTQEAGTTGCDEAYQPLMNDLATLYADHPGGEIGTLYGWPVSGGKYWWAVDRVAKNGYYQNMRLDTGVTSSTNSTSTTGAQICLADPHAPLPATIELISTLPVTASDAIKVKTGEAIPMTVTVKDASGIPVANAGFTLSRSRGVNRGGAEKETGNGGTTDDITLEQLTPTATTVALPRYADSYHGITGADGTATFNLRQDTGMGLKTVITVKMDDYPGLSVSSNVIFTVVSSPDTDKAQYWGHMPETVTSSDGVVFKRPLLMAEAPSRTNTFGSQIYGNETWSLFNHNGIGLASQSDCPAAYQPTLSEMQQLYEDYPDGKLGELFGWPVDRSTFSWWVSDKAGSNYQTIYLMNGHVYSNKTSFDDQALVCLANPHPMPASVKITSTMLNTANEAAVAKKGEAIPFTVTVADRAGNPLANQAFTLVRGESLNRAGEKVAGALTIEGVAPFVSAKSLDASGDTFTGTTGANGSATFTLRQDNSPGLKTTITSQIADNTVIQSSLGVIFTVLTSPDTDKARYWGHMPETVKTSTGITFHRPLLAAEAPSGNGSYDVNNETWSSVNAQNRQTPGATGCDEARQPLFSELQTLYDDNSNGALGTKYGWPVGGDSNYWWASDVDPQTHTYQSINLNTGEHHDFTSTTMYSRQVCLNQARSTLQKPLR